jgi:cation:H+ antiporter
MALDALALIVGLVLLTYAADVFVRGATQLSVSLQVSPIVIGAFVIGFGTSAPELVVSAFASLDGAQDIAIGNVVGSNTANLLLVLGVAAVIATVPVGRDTTRRELPLAIAATVALFLVTIGSIGLWQGVVLLVLAGLTFWLILRTGGDLGEEVEVVAADPDHRRASIIRSSGITLLGLVGTLVGAQLLVGGAERIASDLGVSQAVIGVTIVAIGTSLPELVTAIAASRRGVTDLVIGNVLGSNIFNSLLVAGVSGVLATEELDPSLVRARWLMLAATGLATVLMLTARHVTRTEGVLLLVTYVVVLALTV